MSNIPPLYEGTPLRGDGFILTFAPSGTIAVGNIVTITSGTSWQVVASTTNTQFFLGVALTTGGLAGGAQATFGAQGPTPISVITRGIVDVLVDGAVNAGDFLIPSAITTGYAHGTNTTPFSVSTTITRAVALSGATASAQTIQAFLF